MTTLTLYAARNLDFAPTINVDAPGAAGDLNAEDQ